MVGGLRLQEEVQGKEGQLQLIRGKLAEVVERDEVQQVGQEGGGEAGDGQVGEVGEAVLLQGGGQAGAAAGHLQVAPEEAQALLPQGGGAPAPRHPGALCCLLVPLGLEPPVTL